MKFISDRPFAGPEAADRKLIEPRQCFRAGARRAAYIEQRLQNLAIESHSDSHFASAMGCVRRGERNDHMSDVTENFIITQNIAHYKKLLQKEAHLDKRTTLIQLLENEIGKLPDPVKRAEMGRLSVFR